MYLMQTILRGLVFASNTESVTAPNITTRKLIVEEIVEDRNEKREEEEEPQNQKGMEKGV